MVTAGLGAERGHGTAAARPGSLVASLGVALLAGALLRAFVVRSLLGVPDFDEATVAVQAERFLDGHLGAFFPNQAYGGTLETGLVAVAFRVAGDSPVVLKLVPMLLSLVAAHLGWRVALRVVPGRLGRWAAPVMLWCGSAAAVLQSTKERGFYGVALVLGTAVVLLVLRLADEDDGGDDRRDLVLLGLAVGLGWWATPLTMAVTLPAGVWLLARRPSLLRRAGPGLAAVAIGAGPWLAWNVVNGWASLRAPAELGTTWGDRYRDWVDRLPVVLGTEAPWAPGAHLVPWPVVSQLLVVALVAVATARTWGRAPGLLATLVAGYGVVYALNGLAVGTGGDPRYMYLLTPTVALCIAAALPDPDDDAGRVLGLVATTAVTVALAAWGLVEARDEAERPGASTFVNSTGIVEVTDLLVERDVGTAITDSAGMQVTYLSDGAVVGGSFGVPRLAAAEAASRRDPTSAYVLDAEAFGNAERLDAYLRFAAIPFEHHEVGRWRVFLVDGRVLPEAAGLRSYVGTVPLPVTYS